MTPSSKEPREASENLQSSAPLPPDTPLDAARRIAFDHPTLANLHALEREAVKASRCSCREFCGDVPEDKDSPLAICRNLADGGLRG